MNRRSFINRLFLFTGALSSGLWLPTRFPVMEAKCMLRIVSWGYLEGMLGRKLQFEEAQQIAQDANAIFVIDRVLVKGPCPEELGRIFSNAPDVDVNFAFWGDVKT